MRLRHGEEQGRRLRAGGQDRESAAHRGNGSRPPCVPSRPGCGPPRARVGPAGVGDSNLEVRWEDDAREGEALHERVHGWVQNCRCFRVNMNNHFLGRCGTGCGTVWTNQSEAEGSTRMCVSSRTLRALRLRTNLQQAMLISVLRHADFSIEHRMQLTNTLSCAPVILWVPLANKKCFRQR